MSLTTSFTTFFATLAVIGTVATSASALPPIDLAVPEGGSKSAISGMNSNGDISQLYKVFDETGKQVQEATVIGNDTPGSTWSFVSVKEGPQKGFYSDNNGDQTLVVWEAGVIVRTQLTNDGTNSSCSIYGVDKTAAECLARLTSN